MNEFESPSLAYLDRLVDGELSDAERRDVLAALEREDCSDTCGWRRLALCFVEAQTLRRDLNVMAAPVHQSRTKATRSADVTATSLKAVQRKRTRATIGRTMVAAICCFVAFGLGRNSAQTSSQMAATVPGVVRPEVVTPDTKTFADPNSDASLMAMTSADDAETQQTMRLVLDDLAGLLPQAVDVPVINDSDWDPVTFLDGPPSIPVAVQQVLLRQGRLVHEERQLYPVQLSDGRRGVVPISDVTVIDAGSAIFQ
jgi:hypothetical protein